MYQYKAIIQKVIDGDTLEIDIDLGLSIWVKSEKIRLLGINTPEVFGVKKGSPEWEIGNRASEFVKKLVHENQEATVETFRDKKEKFGRYLANVYIRIKPEELVGLSDIRVHGACYCLNDILIGKGLAEKYMV